MGRIIVSIFIGMLPEILYFTLFLIYAKNLKEKKIRLFFLILITYIMCITIIKFRLMYYLCFIFLVYIILKVLYKQKTQVTDIFLFSISTLYLTILSFLIYFAKNQTTYIVCLILDRLFLFLPFIFRNKFYEIYKKYCSLWNRNDKEKRPIKSITLRNMSLVLINIIILSINIVCLYLTDFIESG